MIVTRRMKTMMLGGRRWMTIVLTTIGRCTGFGFWTYSSLLLVSLSSFTVTNQLFTYWQWLTFSIRICSNLIRISWHFCSHQRSISSLQRRILSLTFSFLEEPSQLMKGVSSLCIRRKYYRVEGSKILLSHRSFAFTWCVDTNKGTTTIYTLIQHSLALWLFLSTHAR